MAIWFVDVLCYCVPVGRYFLDKLRAWSQQEAAAVWALFSLVRHTETRVAGLVCMTICHLVKIARIFR